MNNPEKIDTHLTELKRLVNELNVEVRKLIKAMGETEDETLNTISTTTFMLMKTISDYLELKKD